MNWYEKTYQKDINEFHSGGENAFDLYLRIGARLGHDPNPNFSELLYRNSFRDVYEHLLRHKDDFAFRHYIEFGQHEPGRERLLPRHIDLYRNIYQQLDREFLEKNNNISDDFYVSAYDFYYQEAARREVSPSKEFSETAYRELNPDVKQAVESGNLLSGFAHYIITLNNEKRASMTAAEYEQHQKKAELSKARSALEANLPGVTLPSALELIDHFSFYTDPISVKVTQNSSRIGMLIIIPNYLPEILFGGYKAFFSFLRSFKARTDADLRLLVASAIPDDIHRWNVGRMRLQEPQEASMFSTIEKFSQKRTVELPENYVVISYSAETHYIASTISQKLNGSPFFFIQDYEPDFHAEGDVKEFVKNAFLLKHRAIYNTHKLLEYFRDETDIFRRHGQSYRYCHIDNYIERPRKTPAELIQLSRSKRTRKLVFYGRPEGHAARNNFATFVLGLRRAAERGVFDNDLWEFVSVGSLSYEGSVRISGNLKLEIVAKMAYDDYINMLETGDVGVSFISTPHPGIVHFQMAAYGLITVTNVTKLRTKEWLSSINKNIIGVDLDPESISAGLSLAADRSTDLQRRFSEAQIENSLTKAECIVPALEFLSNELNISNRSAPSEPPAVVVSA